MVSIDLPQCRAVCGAFFDNFQRLRGSDLCMRWQLLLLLLVMLLFDGWMAGLLDGWMAGGFSICCIMIWTDFLGLFWPAADADAAADAPAVCYCAWWFYYFPECISYWVIFRFAFQVMRITLPAIPPSNQPAMNCILIRFMMVSRWVPRTNPPRSRPDLLAAWQVMPK